MKQSSHTLIQFDYVNVVNSLGRHSTKTFLNGPLGMKGIQEEEYICEKLYILLADCTQTTNI